jgi:hypothetical protein
MATSQPNRKSNGATESPAIDAAALPQSPNIFDDLEALRLDTVASLDGTTEVLGHVPVRKPGRVEFFRCHTDPAMSLAASIFEDDEERETYFVAPSARQFLLGHLKPVLLVACISRQNSVFIWPVPLPKEEGEKRGRAWGATARQAADLARTTWIRIRADMSLGAYRIAKAEGALPDPIWPTQTFTELLTIGFADRIVSDGTHPIIRKLRGLS